MSASESAFDAQYYARYYGNPRTRVHGPKEIARLARGVTGMIRWFGGSLTRVLDVGAGTGLWRDWMVTHVKGVQYRSTEVSAHACQMYKHDQRDISQWSGDAREGEDPERYDFVICQGVLPYLSDAECARAIKNLAQLCDGFLYLEAITRRDLDEVCDRELTDVRVHERTGEWYRERLEKHFQQMGCGLWYAKRNARSLGFYELEVPPRAQPSTKNLR